MGIRMPFRLSNLLHLIMTLNISIIPLLPPAIHLNTISVFTHHQLHLQHSNPPHHSPCRSPTHITILRPTHTSLPFLPPNSSPIHHTTLLSRRQPHHLITTHSPHHPPTSRPASLLWRFIRFRLRLNFLCLSFSGASTNCRANWTPKRKLSLPKETNVRLLCFFLGDEETPTDLKGRQLEWCCNGTECFFFHQITSNY